MTTIFDGKFGVGQFSDPSGAKEAIQAWRAEPLTMPASAPAALASLLREGSLDDAIHAAVQFHVHMLMQINVL